MYPHAPLLLLMLLLPLNTEAPQVICALGSTPSSYNAYADQKPTPDAMELARRVSTALVSSCSPNCPTLVLFRNSTAPNAILLADKGTAKMVYAPQFFNSIYEKYGDGAIIVIIAHMLGHGMDATAPAHWMKSAWTPELRADAWAGCALAKAGLSETGVGFALTALSLHPSPSHPAWSQRLPVLRLGYAQCGGDSAKFPAAGSSR